MKKIYDFEQKIHIKGQMNYFRDTSIWHHYELCSDAYIAEEEGKWCFPTFDELWNYLEDTNSIFNADYWTNCFGTRKIRFKCGIDSYTVSEKRYKPVTLWHHFKLAENVSLQTLMENLPAEQMVEYLKERNIGIIEKRG